MVRFELLEKFMVDNLNHNKKTILKDFTGPKHQLRARKQGKYLLKIMKARC